MDWQERNFQRVEYAHFLLVRSEKTKQVLKIFFSRLFCCQDLNKLSEPKIFPSMNLRYANPSKLLTSTLFKLIWEKTKLNRVTSSNRFALISGSINLKYGVPGYGVNTEN